MRILFIGDIVGRSGRNALLDKLPKFIAEWKLDLAVASKSLAKACDVVGTNHR